MTISIEDLYPDLTPEERAEAKQRLSAYVRLVSRIHSLRTAEQVDQAQPAAYDDSRSITYQPKFKKKKL